MFFMIFIPLIITFAIEPIHGQRRASPPRSATYCDEKEWRSRLDKDGSVMFIAGDRTLVVPTNLAEANNYCIKLTISVDSIKDTARTCLKPFPKTVVGLIVHGAKKQIKRICTSDAEKLKFINHASCLKNSSAFNELHNVMDNYVKLVEYVRDNVPDDKKHIDYTCCYYQDLKEMIKRRFKRWCGSEAIEFNLNLVDNMMNDMLDFVCSGHQDIHGPKCSKLLQDAPLSVPKRKRKISMSVLLPLVDIFTRMGAAPDV